MDLQAIG